MMHDGPAVLAELDLERNSPIGTQPPHVFSDQQLGRRYRTSPPIDGHAFLEVDMDRIVPASTAALQGPVLAVPCLCDLELDSAGNHRVLCLSIRRDDPRGGGTVPPIRNACAAC